MTFAGKRNKRVIKKSKGHRRTVRIGDVVRNVDITERKPLENGLERFVGLEHLDPESLHIKRWGNIADGTSFTHKFVKGQVLFGKRRAYQRKAAVAEFDGLCSSDILVFEPKGDELLPELLPFIVQSEGFFQKAMGTSAGSLSPRTKWKDLATYEFALPPKEEQRRIAEVLWSVDESYTLHSNALYFAELAFGKLINDLLQYGVPRSKASQEKNGIIFPAHWDLKTLGEVANVERGKFAHRPRNLARFYGGAYPFVQTGDIAGSNGRVRQYTQTLSEEGKSISKSFPAKSILMTIAAVIGKTAITDFEVWTTDSVVGIKPFDCIDVHFLEFFLRTRQQYLEQKVATQTAQKNINLADLRPMLVPVPPIEEQEQILMVLFDFQTRIEVQVQHRNKIENLKKSLLTRFFP